MILDLGFGHTCVLLIRNRQDLRDRRHSLACSSIVTNAVVPSRSGRWRFISHVQQLQLTIHLLPSSDLMLQKLRLCFDTMFCLLSVSNMALESSASFVWPPTARVKWLTATSISTRGLAFCCMLSARLFSMCPSVNSWGTTAVLLCYVSRETCSTADDTCSAFLFVFACNCSYALDPSLTNIV